MKRLLSTIDFKIGDAIDCMPLHGVDMNPIPAKITKVFKDGRIKIEWCNEHTMCAKPSNIIVKI